MRSSIPVEGAPWWRRRTPILICVTVLVSALIAGGVAVVAWSTPHVVQQAGATVGAGNGVRYEGTVTDSSGRDTDLELTVAADGSAYGVLRRPFGASAEIGFVGADTMIKGNQEWWMSHGQAASGLTDRWISNPPASATDLAAIDLLTPASLGRALAPPGREPWTSTGHRDIGGQDGRAWSDGSRHVVVSADGPPRILAVDIPLVESRYSLTLPVDDRMEDPAARDEPASGLWQAQIDATVTAPTDDELKELEELLGQAEELAGILDEAIQQMQDDTETDDRPGECRPRDEAERAPDGGLQVPTEARRSAAPSIPDSSQPTLPPIPPPPPPSQPDGVVREAPAVSVEAQPLPEPGEAPAGSASGRSVPDPTGGVDLSSLELRYVRDRDTGDGVQYAFSGKPRSEGVVGGTNRGGAQQASDAFFVWLALPPSSFWVNLNPDEPERIIDPRLARTDAGRILLEADLEMKMVSARLLHPDTPLGKRYWDSFQIYNDAFCSSSRYWIVSGPATVVEEDRGLYILDAPLEVRVESMAPAGSGIEFSGQCAGAPPSIVAHNESLERDLVRPQLERAVNESPEFAELRQVHLSRVAAEWYRNRSRYGSTPVDGLIDGEDVSPWVSRVAWSPREIFDRYVESFRNFEFDVVREKRDSDMVWQVRYALGGVDWSQVVFDELHPSQIEKRRPGLTGAVAASFEQPTTDPRGQVWLGSATELPSAWQGPAWPTWSYLAVPVLVAAIALALPRWIRRWRRASSTSDEKAA